MKVKMKKIKINWTTCKVFCNIYYFLLQYMKIYVTAYLRDSVINIIRLGLAYQSHIQYYSSKPYNSASKGKKS